MIKNKHKKTRQEIDEQSKLLKRKRKHKGLPSGSRFNQNEKKSTNNQKEQADPRIGSKKPVPLIIESNNAVTQKRENTSHAKPLSFELELEQLENNPYLDQLIDLIENKNELTAKQQQDLDTMLDRIDFLMNKLGYIDEQDDQADDSDEQPEYQKKEDIMSLLKK